MTRRLSQLFANRQPDETDVGTCLTLNLSTSLLNPRPSRVSAAGGWFDRHWCIQAEFFRSEIGRPTIRFADGRFNLSPQLQKLRYNAREIDAQVQHFVHLLKPGK